MTGLKIGVIGPYAASEPADYEIRTFLSGDAAQEDPVTGSFNAGAAQWLIGTGRAPPSYVASQGTVLGRQGLIYIHSDDGNIWVGGDAVTRTRGVVDIWTFPMSATGPQFLRREVRMEWRISLWITLWKTNNQLIPGTEC